jgi:hypothetical protein
MNITPHVSVTSTNARISQALKILAQIPTFVSILKELETKSPKGLQILVELSTPDGALELGQTSKLSKNDISDTLVDFYKLSREVGVPDSLIQKEQGNANEWERVFQGQKVESGARIFMVRITNQKDEYDLAETIAHEIGAHVRGTLLDIYDHHNEWGSSAQGSAVTGSLASKVMNELQSLKKQNLTKGPARVASPWK